MKETNGNWRREMKQVPDVGVALAAGAEVAAAEPAAAAGIPGYFLAVAGHRHLRRRAFPSVASSCP